MAVVVNCLMRFGRSGEEERSPVCEAADYALGAQDDGASVASDSGETVSEKGFLGERIYRGYSLASLTLPGRTCISLVSMQVRMKELMCTYDRYEFVKHILEMRVSSREEESRR